MATTVAVASVGAAEIVIFAAQKRAFRRRTSSVHCPLMASKEAAPAGRELQEGAQCKGMDSKSTTKQLEPKSASYESEWQWLIANGNGQVGKFVELL